MDDIMNKKFIKEQCRRLKVIHRNESEEVIEENDLDDKWILVHNEGHEELINKLNGYLEFILNNKRDTKRWLRKNIKKSNNIIKNLNKKYNNFVNDEVMNEEDEKIYDFNDGICCMGYTLINIIDGKMYISKLDCNS